MGPPSSRWGCRNVLHHVVGYVGKKQHLIVITQQFMLGMKIAFMELWKRIEGFAMRALYTSFMVAALGIAALASSPARADLIISCSGSGCSGNLGSTPSNTEVAACSSFCHFGVFTIGPLAMVGQSLSPVGTYADIENLDVSSKGAGSLTLSFEETNLTGASAQQFLMNFTGILTGSLKATRTFYLNGTTFLGSCAVGGCGHVMSALENISGTFSLTEDIVLTAKGVGGLLSSDDRIGIPAPEPGTLALLGTGLLGLGALRRRRRAAGTSA